MAIYYRSCCPVCDPPTSGRRPNSFGSPRICPNPPDLSRGPNSRTSTEPFTLVPSPPVTSGKCLFPGSEEPPPHFLVPLPLRLILLREDVVLLVLEAGGGRFVDNDGRMRVELQNTRRA